MEFRAEENTTLIWKSLTRIKQFNDFSKDQLQRAQNIFDTSVKNYVANRNDSLLQNNKNFLSQYLKQLTPSGQAIDLYKQEDIRNKRMADLDNLYQHKSAEYDAYTPDKPKPIDFSDTKESDNVTNIKPLIYSVDQTTLIHNHPLESLLRDILNNQNRILTILGETNKPE